MPKDVVAIIAAMEPEVCLLRDAMVARTDTVIAGMTIYQGQLDGKNIVLMQCGIGKVNAAIGATVLIEHFSADIVINTGSAGALAHYLQVGDVILAQALVHHDADATAFGYTFGQIPRMPLYYSCAEALVDAGQRAIASFSDATVYTGLIASGDQFICDHQARNRIIERHPDVLAVEMEAAAIAQTCFCFAVPCVVIRSVSDDANGSASKDFNNFLAQASKHSAMMVRALLHALDSEV